MADFCGQIILAFLVFSVLCISSVYTGECCKEYTDISLQSHSAQWCSDYCCYDPDTLGFTYYCCSNDLLRAGADMRDSSCIEWLEAHIYAPVLIGVAVLVIVVLTCCCCKFCRRQSPGYIIQGQASAGPVVMVQQQQQQQTMTHQDPMHYGYNQ